MRIAIFLDVDGVLNGFSKRAMKADDHIWYNGRRGHAGIGGIIGMRKCNVNNFKHLYDTLSEKHEIHLVLSSSWRNGHLERFKELIVEHDFYDLPWTITPAMGQRGQEIKDYLDRLAEPERPDFIIIIDDDMYDITRYFVKDKNCYLLHTNGVKGGLTQKLVQDALQRLEKRWSNESI